MTPVLYRKIAAELRQQIVSGQLSPGDHLPTEPQLSEQYGASRNTIRLAIGQLTNEGLVVVVRGRGGGTVVRERATMLDWAGSRAYELTYHASRAEQVGGPISEADAYATEVKQQGRTPTQDFELRLVPASAELAERLEIDENAVTVLRRCHRHVDGQPTSIQDTYYPMGLAEDVRELLSPVHVPHGTTVLLAERGHVQIAYRDEIIARMPSPEETRMLELPAGTPLLEYVRTGYTSTRPVRVTRTIFASDRNRIVYTLGDPSTIARDTDG